MNNEMKMKRIPVRSLFLVMAALAVLWGSAARTQVYDTISNWETVTPDWTVWAGSGEQVANPWPGGINTSANCMELTTSSGAWDLMFIDLDVPVNFEMYPKYRFKVYAPPSGGQVALKFENENNTQWEEIVKTPVPGQWDDLEFDFSGLVADEFVRMVVFIDFQGTTPGIDWYVDDVIRSNFFYAEFSSALPIVKINTGGIPIPDEPKITAQMQIIDNGPGNLNFIGDDPNGYDGFIGIEIRGSSSQMFPKKSFGLETRDETGENLNVSLLGMPEENDWILYGPYSDKSMMRNAVAYILARRMGGYAPRCVYCELFINNGYHGLYMLMEKIKRDRYRVDIDRLEPDENDGLPLTGGYMISVDKTDNGFQYGPDGWLSSPVPSYPNAMDITFQYVYPDGEDITFQQKGYIQNFIAEVEQTLVGSGFAHTETGYHKYFDASSFVDHLLIRELAKEVDAYRYSTFFFKHNDEDGGKFHSGPPWDFNLGFGNVNYWEPGVNPAGWVYVDVTPVNWSIMYWWKRLMEDSYFRNLVRTRWTGLRAGPFSDASILALTDSLAAVMGEARERNFMRWPVLGEWVWPNYFVGDTWEEERDYLEDFLLDRTAWMDEALAGTLLDPGALITGDKSRLHVTLSDEYFNKTVLEKDAFGLVNAPPGLAIDTVVYVKAHMATAYLSGAGDEDPEVALWISSGVLNGWQDLTSNPLVLDGVEERSGNVPEVNVRVADGLLHLHCARPEQLPQAVSIYAASGRLAGRHSIAQVPGNAIRLNLPAGLYLLRVDLPAAPVIRKFTWF